MSSPRVSRVSRRQMPGVTLGLALALAACSGDSGPAAPTRPTEPDRVTPRFQTGVPVAWFGGTGAAGAYDVGLDVGVRRTGTASAYLTARRTPPSGQFAFIGQAVSATTWRGKRVRLSAWVRADSIVGFAGLWLRVDGPTGPLAFDNQQTTNRAVRGTSDWQQQVVVLDVPAASVSINLGALLNGTGTFRVDDARFEVVDPSVPVTAPPVPSGESADTTNIGTGSESLAADPVNLDFEGLPATESAWLATVAQPFTTELPGSGFEDLAELGRITGTARVVGFGEATHGTSEFFRMKHRAFEYLVERHGFTHFTIEATMPESRAMDRYVTRGEGDPARLLSNLYFWTWNTQEVLDLVRWMRAYNVRVGAPRLRFFGFDMQFPEHAIDSTITMLSRLEPDLSTRARRTVECLAPGRLSNGNYNFSQYRAVTTPASQTACVDSLQALLTTVQTARPSWAGRMASDDLDWLVQYVRLVGQWAQMGRANDGAGIFAARDRAMADNLLWVADREPTARLFAWAHNGHVTRRAPAMCANLAVALGESYRVFGFTFGTGRFNAVGVEGNTFTTLTSHGVNAIPPWSLESVFARANQPRLLFDARRITTGGDAAASLRGQPLRMRGIGALYSESFADTYFDLVRLPQEYDALIWFAATSPSVLLPFIR